MNHQGQRIAVASLMLISLLSGHALTAQESPSPQTMEKSNQARIYTSYNLWYEKPDRMYCVNYARGARIPAGTEVMHVDIGRKVFKRHPLIRFTTKDNREYTIYFNKKFHPGVTIEEFKDRLFTKKSFAELTKGLTEKEIESIKKGRLVTGMSKQAVLITMGYPPEHQTPSLDESQWYYWANRFRKEAVRFDENGRTSQVPIE